MTVLTRFAPSPTGRLHLGNIRRALDGWLFARSKGGKFMLRMDDTDLERSTLQNAQTIEDDLHWLGLDWDLFERQSDRFHRYAEIKQELIKKGRLYPCYETAEELALKRKIAVASGRPPLYDRAALTLTEEKRKAYEAEGRKPHWRFLVSDGTFSWEDMAHGPLQFESKNLSDPVLFRTDGFPIYTLASVVDDMDFGITHIIRGDDHISNTALHIDLIAALGGDPQSITFAHLPLLTAEEGTGFSKREGSLHVGTLKEMGLEPLVILTYLSKLGTSMAPQPVYDKADLIKDFDIHAFGKGSPPVSMAELKALNARFYHGAPYSLVKNRVSVDEKTWNILRTNIIDLEDLKQWEKILNGQLDLPVLPQEDKDYLTLALESLPAEPWTTETWAVWVEALKEKTHRRGKALFLPLRLALTGQIQGPEMRDILLLLGKEKVEFRLKEGAKD